MAEFAHFSSKLVIIRKLSVNRSVENFPKLSGDRIIGSLHEISIAFRHTWLESVFHADSHGIYFFF